MLRKLIICVSVIVLTANLSCKKEELSCVSSLSPLTQKEEIKDPIFLDDKIETVDNIECIIERYKWAPGNEESLLLDPSTGVIYPGALLKSGSVLDGSYVLIGLKHGSITLSHSANGQSVTIHNPTLSKVRNAVFEITKSIVITPAKMTYKVKEIHSSEHLDLALKGNYKSMSTSVSTEFNWQKTGKVTRILVEFYQLYYSIDVDQKENASDWVPGNETFCDEVDQLPMYVSSVKYGRVGMLTLETSLDATEVKAALNASFDGIIGKGGIDINSEYAKVWNSSTFKVLVVGGAPSEGVKAITGIQGFNQWIVNGAEYSDASPGSPIAYTLKYIDGSNARIVKSGEYNVRKCSYPEPCPSEIQKLDYVGGNSGSPFDFTFPDCSKIESIQIRSGQRIDKIVINYRDDNDRLRKVSYGGNGGTLHPTIHVTSKIVKITGSAGDRIDSIRFHFANGTSSPSFGNSSGGNTFEFPIDNLGGVYGKSGAEIDRLGFYNKI